MNNPNTLGFKKVHITVGSAKMLHIPSINTPTHGNSFCEKMRLIEGGICEKCYAYNYESFRPTLLEAIERNLWLAERPILPAEIPRFNTQIVRLHSYGELLNVQHLLNYVTIVKANPWSIVTLWTKRANIVHRVFDLKLAEKPENLIIIYSSLLVNRLVKVPRHFDKVFTAFDKGVSDDINCHGSCNECRLCYSHNQVTHINEVRK
jgi:hypothetical protein